ncbi:MAG TPA: hypothetical protein VHD35_08440 [Chitinophagaceae bacterium]|jgi:hypothetical protein|nr:hypothetical protein [Chitinophagaceae bacterium]
MEVHHHTHPDNPDMHRGRKKFTHYLWEFLMLFLAVFCGFLAENEREHLVENKREKEYIISYVEDLKQDTAELSQIISVVDQKLLFRDSLLKELSNPSVFSNSSKAYYYLVASFHFPDFIYNDRTIQQLKNSGGMRLIRNKTVSDSMMDYDSYVRTLFIHQEMMNDLSLNFGKLNNRLFQKRLLDTANKGSDIKPIPLLSSSKTDLEEFYNNMSDQRAGFVRLKFLDTELLAKATRFIAFIKKEYRLK